MRCPYASNRQQAPDARQIGRFVRMTSATRSRAARKNSATSSVAAAARHWAMSSSALTREEYRASLQVPRERVVVADPGSFADGEAGAACVRVDSQIAWHYFQ
jgi:hypothetical protein